VNEAERLGVKVLKNSSVKHFKPTEEGWQVTTMNKHYHAKKLLLATGSNPKIWKQLEDMGHHIVPPVPSLFTFNIYDERIRGIQGISVNASVEVLPKKLFQTEKQQMRLKSATKNEP